MKTFKFNICKYTITVTIEKKSYKTTTNYQDEIRKPHMFDLKDVKIGEPVVCHGPFPGYSSEEIKMEAPKTVSECVTEYIDSQRGILSYATIKGYENIRDKHFADLMSCRMKYIDEGVIQRSFDEEIEKGYSKKTIKGYRSFILKVLAVYRQDLKPEIRVEKGNAE